MKTCFFCVMLFLEPGYGALWHQLLRRTLVRLIIN